MNGLETEVSETPGAGREQGSGTVLALGAIAALLLLAGLVYLLSASAVAAAQSARGADLAALAGADAARGLVAEDPCSLAEEVASANGVVLESCAVGGEFGTEVTVEVSKDLLSVTPLNPSWLPLPEIPAKGVSRAGPPESLE